MRTVHDMALQGPWKGKWQEEKSKLQVLDKSGKKSEKTQVVLSTCLEKWKRVESVLNSSINFLISVIFLQRLKAKNWKSKFCVN